MSYSVPQLAQFSKVSTGQPGVASGAFAGSVTAGNVLLCLINYYSGTECLAVPSRGGDTFTLLGSYFSASFGAGLVAYLVQTAGAGTTEVQSTFTTLAAVATNVDYPAIAVVEFGGLRTSGVSGATPVMVGQSNPGTGTNAITTGNITPSAQPAAIVGISIDTGNQETPAAGTGYTGLGGIWDYEGTAPAGAQIIHKGVANTSPTAATWTTGFNGSTDSYINAVFVLLEPSVAADVSLPPTRPGRRQALGNY